MQKDVKKVEIYIKPLEKVQIIKRRNVLLKDVAEVYAEGNVREKAEGLVIFEIPSEKKKTYLLSVIDLITVIHQHFPKASSLLKDSFSRKERAAARRAF